jgi:hypothetical protein
VKVKQIEEGSGFLKSWGRLEDFKSYFNCESRLEVKETRKFVRVEANLKSQIIFRL